MIRIEVNHSPERRRDKVEILSQLVEVATPFGELEFSDEDCKIFVDKEFLIYFGENLKASEIKELLMNFPEKEYKEAQEMIEEFDLSGGING